jgi:glucosamine kinase
MENYYIGIDSGGSNSRILITDDKGNPIAKEQYHSIHYSTFGKDAVAQFLSNKILELTRKNKLVLKNCRGIAAGIAGARNNTIKKAIADAMKRFLKFRRIIIETDTYIAYYGAFEGQDGIILINGTGSIIYGKIDRKLYRIGGWGKILGDAGSGYSIGIEALKAATEDYDFNRKSKLTRELNKKFGINKDTILKKVYQENFEAQKLTPFIFQLAEKSDKTCRKIIDRSTLDLLSLITTFLSVFGKRKKIKLAFIGSVLENKNLLSRKLKKLIRNKFRRRIELSVKKFTPEYGAYLIAKDYYN